jgi:methionyl-tRNA synthetase
MVYAHESLRITGIALQPVMPTKMKDLLNRLGVEEQHCAWERLQLEEGKEQIHGVLACVKVMMDRAKDFKKVGVLFPPLLEHQDRPAQ